jgi:hypothetical protein
LQWFTWYVNVAVVGNIAGMVAAPTNGTLRGNTGRVVCLALTYRLLRHMAAVQWRTLRPNRGAFAFTASPLSWVGPHALYRAAMMTLPVFEGRRYLLLEPLSVIGMCLAHRRHVAGTDEEPIAWYFGASDTAVVPTMGLVSHLSDAYFGMSVVPALQWPREADGMLDAIAVPLQLAALIWCLVSR